MDEHKLDKEEFINLQIEDRYAYLTTKMKDAVAIATYGKGRMNNKEDQKKKSEVEIRKKREPKRNNSVSDGMLNVRRLYKEEKKNFKNSKGHQRYRTT